MVNNHEPNILSYVSRSASQSKSKSENKQKIEMAWSWLNCQMTCEHLDILVVTNIKNFPAQFYCPILTAILLNIV